MAFFVDYDIDSFLTEIDIESEANRNQIDIEIESLSHADKSADSCRLVSDVDFDIVCCSFE